MLRRTFLAAIAALPVIGRVKREEPKPTADNSIYEVRCCSISRDEQAKHGNDPKYVHWVLWWQGFDMSRPIEREFDLNTLSDCYYQTVKWEPVNTRGEYILRGARK